MSDALKQSLDLSMFFEYRAILLQGLVFNALVFLCAAGVALSVGLCAALMRINRLWPMRWLGTLHVELFRNAPDYIMLVWVHFVLPLLIGIAIRRRVEFHPFASAVIALGFVYSGYFAEAFRAGISRGDVILQVNRRAVRTPQEASRALAQVPANGTAFLLILRGGQETFITVRKE